MPNINNRLEQTVYKYFVILNNFHVIRHHINDLFEYAITQIDEAEESVYIIYHRKLIVYLFLMNYHMTMMKNGIMICILFI